MTPPSIATMPTGIVVAILARSLRTSPCRA